MQKSFCGSFVICNPSKCNFFLISPAIKMKSYYPNIIILFFCFCFSFSVLFHSGKQMFYTAIGNECADVHLNHFRLNYIFQFFNKNNFHGKSMVEFCAKMQFRLRNRLTRLRLGIKVVWLSIMYECVQFTWKRKKIKNREIQKIWN